MNIRSRRGFLGVVLGGAVLGLAGCFGRGDDSAAAAARDARNDQAVDLIQETLRRESGDTTARVVYQHGFMELPTVAATLLVEGKDDSALTPWMNRVAELVWRSSVAPLDSIVLDIGWRDPDDATRIGGRNGLVLLAGKQGRAELEAKYGPRPVADDA